MRGGRCGWVGAAVAPGRPGRPTPARRDMAKRLLGESRSLCTRPERHGWGGVELGRARAGGNGFRPAQVVRPFRAAPRRPSSEKTPPSRLTQRSPPPILPLALFGGVPSGPVQALGRLPPSSASLPPRYRFNQAPDFDSYVDRDSSEARLRNFCLLEGSLRRLGIPFGAKDASSIFSEKPGGAQRLLYQIKMVIDKLGTQQTVIGHDRGGVKPLCNMPLRMSKPTCVVLAWPSTSCVLGDLAPTHAPSPPSPRARAQVRPRKGGHLREEHAGLPEVAAGGRHGARTREV